MSSRFVRELERRPLVFDGGMGSTIQDLPLDVERDYLGHENCVDLLVRSRPELVQSIHESFLEAGADVVETNTFGANQLVFAEFDDELVSWTRDLNREAAEIARAACAAYATRDRPRFVLGSLGPGTKLLSLGQTTWRTMLESYAEQTRGLIEGGVDALIIETCQDLLQVKCAINACQKALDESGRTPSDIPIMVSVTIETNGAMLLGSDLAAAVTALRGFPIVSLGLNCATGPTEMADHLAYLVRHWDRAISVIPNAGLPVLVEGRTSFPLQPEPFARILGGYAREHGLNVVGGCCGTTPAHIEALVSAVGEAGPSSGGRDRSGSAWSPGCASLFSHTDYEQENSFLIVAERMNASGSRRFKRLLEGEEWDQIVSLAREQMREGANVLDINVDYVGRDNAADMAEIVRRVVGQVDAPLMIDSTQIATIEAGLEHAPGKCLINSANFEDGEERFDHVCALARTYGAGVVIGTIDEDQEAAMARTADRKLAIAERAIRRATERHGLAPEDLFIDPLVLPITTGMEADRRSALELVDGIKRISSEFPRCNITCGLSNVSFGLLPPARTVLNSVLLHELVEAGLTSAIVHVAKIVPLNRIPEDRRRAALDLVYDRRAESVGGTGLPPGVDDEAFDPLHAFIELFKDAADDAGPAAEQVTLTLEEALRHHIVDGEKQGLTERLDEALEKYAPLEIINDHLLAGMKTVGELFGSGQMQLPFVLQSAEVMKMAVAHLEPHMERHDEHTRGAIVLATVKGDVHDIGKNLVDILLTNNGYTVHNMGIKQPIGPMVEKLRETDADAIGMSGLLVKSVMVMEENLRELNNRNVRVPVLLGGAALRRDYAEGHLREIYEGPLYYGRDAFEGLRIFEHLAADDLPALDIQIDERVGRRAAAAERVQQMRGPGPEGAAAVAVAISEAPADVDIPLPPFWGSRVVEEIDLDEVFAFVNTAALFRGQWGFKKGAMNAQEFEANRQEIVEPLFERLKVQCRDEGILQPRVVYGFFPCTRAAEDLVVYDPEDHEREIERFSFPRQPARRRLCISDFFRRGDEGERDVVGFHCVTMGAEVGLRARRLFESHAYTEYLYLHGLGVEAAEALAELWHKRMRAELGIGGDDSPRIRELFTQKYRGSRYSFGYPACPDMSDQEKLFRLLGPDRIGCRLTENWQIDPEQSTSAIIVHHPEAKYFNV